MKFSMQFFFAAKIHTPPHLWKNLFADWKWEQNLAKREDWDWRVE